MDAKELLQEKIKPINLNQLKKEIKLIQQSQIQVKS